MRRWLILSLVVAAALAWWLLADLTRTSRLSDPRYVPSGDQELAWLHTTTAGSTWERFVTGLKQAERTVPGLRVDDSEAFQDHTTNVPEVVLSKDGHAGKVRVRWYKLSSDATAADWVKSLAARSPAPLALIGGGTSDRALDLARAMACQNEWKGERPLLLITTATADEVDYGPDGAQCELIDVYPKRSFRFCFTNQQMAEAVTDYVANDPTLRPGPVAWPGLRTATFAAAGPWAAVAAAGEMTDERVIKVFAIAWQDDPYSSDLSWQFRVHLLRKYGPDVPPAPPFLRTTLHVDQSQPPFSVGSQSKPNRAEAELVDHILGGLPPRGERSILILPTIAPPAWRALRTLTEGVPLIGRRLVAVTGDGISVNTIYRDGEFAWPVRAMPVPLVMFTHANPFGWDGDALRPPSSTDDVLHFAELARVVAEGVFPPPDAAARFTVQEGLLTNPEHLAARFGEREPRFFDPKGNRLGGQGEYVIVLRPTIRDSRSVGKAQEDAMIEVYRRGTGRAWVLVKAVPIAHGRAGEEVAVNTTPPAPSLAFWKYTARVLLAVLLWAVPVGWLAWLIVARANWSHESDKADVREWLDEARNFRKTLPELVREYAAILDESPPGPGHDKRRENKADELAEHMRSLAEPTQMYTGQLPLFPEIYKLEVSFPGLGVPTVGWESALPKPRQQSQARVQQIAYSPAGDGRAVIRCEYKLHALNTAHLERRATRNAQLVAAGILAAALVIVITLVWRALRREWAQEVQRWEAEHRERELLEARVKQQEAERESEELNKKLLEQELDTAKLESRAAEAEKSALELKSQLYASIGIMAGSYAHNIKNLLVRPNDLLTRCIEANGLRPEQEGMLSEVKTTLGTVTERLQQILRTVRRDPGKSDVTKIDINEMVRETQRTWTEMAWDKWKLRLSAETCEGALLVSGDVSHLQQAIENLLFNARDATFEMRNKVRDAAWRLPRGPDRNQRLIDAASWKGEVSLRTRHDGDFAVLELRDNGIGMTPEVRENCLTTHFTTKRDNALYEGLSAGMGLGLSFVAVVLEHHGATLQIESEPQQGALFRVRLPLAKE